MKYNSSRLVYETAYHEVSAFTLQFDGFLLAYFLFILGGCWREMGGGGLSLLVRSIYTKAAWNTGLHT